MESLLRRKGTIGTLREAVKWLRRNPALIIAFFLYGLVSALSDGSGYRETAFTIVAFLVVIYVDGLAHAVGEQEANSDSSDLGRATTTVLSQFSSLVGSSIVYGVAVGLGLVFLVLPGIYIAIRLSLAFPACVIDELDWSESLRRSWSVAHGNLAKLFGISLVSLVVFAGGISVTLVATDLSVTEIVEGSPSTYLAATVVLTAIFRPIVQLAHARVYLENRPRPETPADDNDDSREKPPWTAAADGAQSGREDDRWGAGS